MAHNSTIRPKLGICPMCSDSKGRQPLTKGLCQMHYWQENKLKSASKQSEREVKEAGLSDLVDILDGVFSRYIRLKYADENGYVYCYTSGERMHYKDADCGHFITRGCMYLRWDERNTRVQGRLDNRVKDGQRAIFAKKLNEEYPGIVDILNEEAHMQANWSRFEINAMIKDFRQRVKKLESKINDPDRIN